MILIPLELDSYDAFFPFTYLTQETQLKCHFPQEASSSQLTCLWLRFPPCGCHHSSCRQSGFKSCPATLWLGDLGQVTSLP